MVIPKDLVEFQSLPAPRQDQELAALNLAGVDSYILQALAVDDRETLAFLVPYHRNRCEANERLAIILKTRDWFLEKTLELWRVNESYESFAEYVQDQSQEAYSTVLNYCALWEFYHETLGWPSEKMAMAGMKKLECVLPMAKRKVEDGALDIDLEDLLLDENVSYRDLLKHYRKIKEAELWGDEQPIEDKPGLKFRLYSFEHTEKHWRGILEAIEYIDGNAVVQQVCRFSPAQDVRHYVYTIADKIGAEVM